MSKGHHTIDCPSLSGGLCNCLRPFPETVRPSDPAEVGPLKSGTPTKPVSDPRQCPRCRLIHVTGVCPVAREGVGYDLARGYHTTPSRPVEAPSVAAITPGGRIVHGRTGGRLEGLYRTPDGTPWALVEWDGGTRSLMEPGKLRPEAPAERPRCVVINGETLPLNTVADASAARNAFQLSKAAGDSNRLRVLYADTGEAVDGLFGWFVAS